MKLNKKESEVLESVERGEWKSIAGFKGAKSRYEDYAQATIRKDKRVNIRMAERDLVYLQKRALEEGLPYQTLISSILHKYINGRLVDRD
ncbi:MAG: antitoxin [Candidatus Omnitrophica bacterium]|nr:antitoxin [Candidatus Omnitrophota bacterium]